MRLKFTMCGYTCDMAAQGHPSDGWFDTPVHPAIGFLLFVVGLVAFFVLTLYLVAEASGY